ncbi:uncharacterized protein LOC105789591 [Gossypium raimondii]|uniref:uncharacterized protein LOC105789591 n=1 Tax=Gossypium raimondii TaxID=29730 RepID=UPI00063ABDBB|nr:uncharacterized protein LOC105789591 [Gossypium raimondii]
MPNYVKFMKDILSKKRRLGEFETIALIEGCTTLLKNKLPQKLKDPGSFTIPCSIGNHYVGKSLCNLGASINLMSMFSFRKLGIGNARPIIVTLQLADKSYVHPEGKIEDIVVRVEKFIFPTDSIILECEADKEVPIILGRPFLATGRTLIDVQKELTEESGELMEIQQFGNGFRRSFESLYLSVIFVELTINQEMQLLKVLKKSKKALEWSIADIKGIIPATSMHKIILEDFHGKSIEQQRRLSPVMKEVDKKEIIKWLDVGIIYLISDSFWEFDLEIKDRKGTENQVADHLSRLEAGNNYVSRLLPPALNHQGQRKFFHDVKQYYWDEPFLFKQCADQVIRRCIPDDEIQSILYDCHSAPYGGHFGSMRAATKAISSVVKKYGWGIFCRHPGDVFPKVVKEFYAHVTSSNSAFIYVRGASVLFDEDSINAQYGLFEGPDEHADFMKTMSPEHLT